MAQPVVSVVVPTFNRALCLPHAGDSILGVAPLGADGVWKSCPQYAKREDLAS